MRLRPFAQLVRVYDARAEAKKKPAVSGASRSPLVSPYTRQHMQNSIAHHKAIVNAIRLPQSKKASLPPRFDITGPWLGESTETMGMHRQATGPTLSLSEEPLAASLFPWSTCNDSGPKQVWKSPSLTTWGVQVQPYVITS